MGDTDNNNDVSATDPTFSPENAASALRIAELPNIYEKTYYVDKDRAAAQDSLQEHLPDGVKAMNIINVDSTTVILVYDPEQNRVTVALDPTHTAGDRWDNFRRGHAEHTLGGDVHKGLYQDIVEKQNGENFPGDNMAEVIEGVLHDYASRNPDAPLFVDFTGFSSAGAQAAMTAGELIGRDFFKNNPNIKLDDIYTFAPPSYADSTFTGLLESRAESLGANAWMIQIHGDTIPAVLSEDGPGVFTRYDYGFAGDHVYIVPSETDDQPQVLINPDEATLGALPDPTQTRKEVHTFDSYGATLGQINPTQPAAEIEPEPVTPSVVAP